MGGGCKVKVLSAGGMRRLLALLPDHILVCLLGIVRVSPFLFPLSTHPNSRQMSRHPEPGSAGGIFCQKALYLFTIIQCSLKGYF